MNADKIINESEQIAKDFEECNKIMTTIDISKLPFELQMEFAYESTKLMSAMKTYNDHVKQIIIKACILGRT